MNFLSEKILHELSYSTPFKPFLNLPLGNPLYATFAETFVLLNNFNLKLYKADIIIY